MPSALPLPTVSELVQAFNDGVRGSKSEFANLRTGSAYNHFAGVGAILFSRAASRDRDLFRAIYFDTAEGDQLSKVGLTRFGIERTVSSYGRGLATLSRPTADAGADTIWAGTRIVISGASGRTEAVAVVVSDDTPYDGLATNVPVPVRADKVGTGTALRVYASDRTIIRIDDDLADPTWTCSSIDCAEGTDFEAAPVYRSRVRQTRLDERVGYLKGIFSRLADVGAVNAVAFPSNYTGDANDYGLNLIYVADAGFSASAPLLRKCMLVVDDAAVFGTSVQVLPIINQNIKVNVTVTLWDSPGNFNLPEAEYDVTSALTGYFDGRENNFTFQLDAMAGAIQVSNAAVRSATVTLPTASATLTTGSPPRFPPYLQRYTLAAQNINVTFRGP